MMWVLQKNSGDSYRFGLELDATIAITDKLLIRQYDY
jgi:hypothetical protein